MYDKNIKLIRQAWTQTNLPVYEFSVERTWTPERAVQDKPSWPMSSVCKTSRVTSSKLQPMCKTSVVYKASLLLPHPTEINNYISYGWRDDGSKPHSWWRTQTCKTTRARQSVLGSVGLTNYTTRSVWNMGWRTHAEQNNGINKVRQNIMMEDKPQLAIYLSIDRYIYLSIAIFTGFEPLSMKQSETANNWGCTAGLSRFWYCAAHGEGGKGVHAKSLYVANPCTS